jgi:ferredoxin
MAEINNKHEGNVPGRYYVDRECIGCDACVLAAPDHFKMNPLDAHAYVAQQPASETDEEQCREALENCPVSAIGNNG